MTRLARLRRIALVLVTALIVLLAGLLIFVHVALEPERFTAMLQRIAFRAGVELTLANPAKPTLWPRPAIELQGIDLRDANGAPILLAAHGRLVLPWRALLHGETAMSRIELDSPRVDLDALSTAIERLPQQSTDDRPFLPTLDAGLSITSGTLIRNNAVLFSDLNLDTGRLANGKPFHLTLHSTSANGKPLSLKVDAVPRLQGHQLTLTDIAVDLATDAATSATLRGNGYWRGAANLALSLQGEFVQAKRRYAVLTTLTPANLVDPLRVHLKVDGADDHVDVQLPPLAIAQWWSSVGAGAPLTLPEFTGQVQ
jgi:uncharacterized protein involved in outer membrane biogenesis